MYIIQVIFSWTMSLATELRLFHSLIHTDYKLYLFIKILDSLIGKLFNDLQYGFSQVNFVQIILSSSYLYDCN